MTKSARAWGAISGGAVIWIRVAIAALVAASVACALLAAWALLGHDNRDAFADTRPPPGLAERFYPPEGWAWGLLQARDDAPVQRYGVAGASSVTRAQVLILPDYGESAETWFETVRDLNAAGYAVWVLEGVGQGGSARLTGHRDLGEVTSFDADVAGVRALVDDVIRPTTQRPLILLGQGVGALIAASAVQNRAPVAGLILDAPDCQAQPPLSLLARIGLGAVRAPGEAGWRRDGPDDFSRHRTHDRWRGAVGHAWQLINPDLRMGGPSLDWQAALGRIQPAVSAAPSVPTLLVEPQPAAGCSAPPTDTYVAAPDADPALELEDDARRAPWLAAITKFLAAHAPQPIEPQPRASPHGP